jgi:hypothetical protein
VWKDCIGRPETATGYRLGRRGHAHVGSRTWFGRWRLARYTLLEQQFRRLHSRVGMKALDHPIGKECIGQGDQRHAFMVR